MRKLNFTLLATLILGSLIFTSCKDEPVEEVEPQENPTIAISVIGAPSYVAGSTVQYKIEVTSPEVALTAFAVRGLGDIQPGEGSGITSSEPSNAWDATNETFKAETLTATLYYKLVIPATVADDTSFDIKFSVAAGTKSGPETITIVTGSSIPQPTMQLNVIGSPDYASGTEGSTVHYTAVLSSPNAGLVNFTAQGTGAIHISSESGVTVTENPDNAWDDVNNVFTPGITSVTIYYDLVIPAGINIGQEFEVEFKVTDDVGEATKKVTITIGGDE